MQKFKDHWVLYIAIIVWMILLGVVLDKVIQIESISTQARSVYPLFYNVGRAWADGRSVYAGVCEYYLYWPGFAALISIITVLPFHYSVIVWVVLSIGMLFYSLFMLGRVVFCYNNRVGVLLLLAVPLAFEGLYNQQSNAIVISSVLFGSVLLLKKRYWLGAALVVIASIAKIAPVSFALMFLLLFPKELWWRYIIVTIGLLCLPLFLGDIKYVWSQYCEWIDILQNNISRRWQYRDLWTLYELCVNGEVVDEPVAYWYRGIQFIGAAFLAGKCIWMKYYRKYSRKEMIVFVIMSASVWWLLLGPSTEIATCVVSVGVAGLGVMLARLSRIGWYYMLFAYICVAVGSSGDYEYHIRQFTTSDWIYGLLPFGALLMYIWVFVFSAKAVKSLALTSVDKKVL